MTRDEESAYFRTIGVCAEVSCERTRQDAKFGDQSNRIDGTRGGAYQLSLRDAYREICDDAEQHGGGATWFHILREEIYEAFAETDPTKLRKELIQVAAVAVAWVEAIDKREGR